MSISTILKSITLPKVDSEIEDPKVRLHLERLNDVIDRRFQAITEEVILNSMREAYPNETMPELPTAGGPTWALEYDGTNVSWQ